MRVAVIGSGGVGGFVGGSWRRPATRSRSWRAASTCAPCRRRGLRVQSTDGDFDIPSVTATDQPGELGPADLFLFTVKSYDTDEAAALLKPLLQPGATVLTLQNGIDNHERIDAVLGDGVALPGTIRIETTIAEPGLIAHTSPGYLIRFGEGRGRRPQERARRAATRRLRRGRPERPRPARHALRPLGQVPR